MTYRQAIFLKLILCAGFSSDYSSFLEEILMQADSLDGMLLDLAYSDKDSTRSISILEEYISIIEGQQDDWLYIFEDVRIFLAGKYFSGKLTVAELIQKMYVIAKNVDIHNEYPWADMWLMDEDYDLMLDGYISEKDFYAHLESCLQRSVFEK